jgi:hypothetical protein
MGPRLSRNISSKFGGPLNDKHSIKKLGGYAEPFNKETALENNIF